VPKPRPEEAGEADKPEVDLLGQLSVSLGGTHYTLRPSRQAISNIEQQLGKSLTQLTVQSGSLTLPVSDLGVCVAELMRAYAVFDDAAGPDYKGAKPDRCADLIFESGPVDVSRRLAVIFTGALSGGYTASGEAKAAGTTTTEPTPTAD
jgi:hypothetical protein